MSTDEPTKSGTLTVKALKGETQARAMARISLTPNVKAAITLRAASKPTLGDLVLNDLADELASCIAAARNDDLSWLKEVLAAQAVVLDGLFHDLAQRGLLNAGVCLNAAEAYMRLAIKAQSQCRATVEALNAMKHLPNVNVVRQANVGQNVQLTSRVVSAKSETEQSELMEGQHGERLDDRAARQAGATDSAMATVGTIYRTAVVKGKGNSGAQRLQRRPSRHAAGPATPST